jgi:hypothetical protein
MISKKMYNMKEFGQITNQAAKDFILMINKEKIEGLWENGKLLPDDE